MIEPDPFGGDPLDSLQDRSLRFREMLTRKWKNPFRNDYEPETVAEAHWWVQPKWVKIISVVVGLPAFGILYWQFNYGGIDTRVYDVCVSLFIAVALLQMIFVFRGYWRMDI